MARPADEHWWVERARTGDPDAAAWLYERYVERIHRYVYLKVGDPTEAEDITEHVFLKMLEAIGAFRWQGSSFASWLFRIAHNQVVDHVRSRARHPQVSLEPVGVLIPSDTDDPYRWAERDDFRRHLVSCMAELTDLQAQVIQLKFWGGLSNAEVARIMDRTEGAIKALQYSALQNLQKLMSARGY